MPFQGTIYLNHHRHSRFARPDNAKPLRLTERDRAIVAAVASYRCLRSDQLQALFFPSRRTCNRALARLYHHRFLQRLRPLIEWGSGDCPTIYVLDTKGRDLLTQAGLLEHVRISESHKPISRYFLDHTLALNGVCIALTRAAHTQGITLERWISEAEFRHSPDKIEYSGPQNRVLTRAIRPDAACILRQPHYTSRLLLEIDRATEDNPRFVRDKVRPGVAYLKSRAYKARFGFNSGRWLVVTTSETRLANMKRATEAAVGREASVFYFTTFAQMNAETVLTAPIWYRGNRHRPQSLLHSVERV